MPTDLRCPNGILHGKLVDGAIEVSCRSYRCGFRRGDTVVLHRFSVEDGKLLQTLSFREPQVGRNKHNDDAHTAAVRTA